MALKAKYLEGEGGPPAISTSDGTTLEKGGDAVEVTEMSAEELRASAVGHLIEISGRPTAAQREPEPAAAEPAEPERRASR